MLLVVVVVFLKAPLLLKFKLNLAIYHQTYFEPTTTNFKHPHTHPHTHTHTFCKLTLLLCVLFLFLF